MTDSTENTEKPKKSLLSQILTVVLPLALGVTIIYFLIRDIDLLELWTILRDANWGILLFSLLFGLLGNTIRGYRWRLLIKPLGYTPSVTKLNLSIYGGYAVNFAIPRAGEVWRCGIIAKEEKVPFTKLFGTMLLDRVFDTITVAIITLVAFAFNMKFFISQLKHNEEVVNSIMGAIKSPTPYIIIGLIVLLIFIVFKYFSENKIVKKVKEALLEMARDMKAIWKMKEKGWLLFYSVAIWCSYFCYFYITFFAFDFTENLGITAGLIAFALSSVSMGIPSNGGLGPWQVAVIASLTLYGVTQLEATAFATGVFMLQSSWVILCGLVGIAALAFMKKPEAPATVGEESK